MDLTSSKRRGDSTNKSSILIPSTREEQHFIVCSFCVEILSNRAGDGSS